MTSFDYVCEAAELAYRTLVNNAIRAKPIATAIKSLEDEYDVVIGFIITTDGSVEVSASKDNNICHKRYRVGRDLVDRIYWTINFVG
jgi:hypothetical protein